MPVLDLPFAIPVVPVRDRGTDGNPDWQPLAQTRMVVSLGAPVLVDGKGSRYTQSGTVGIPRDYDTGDLAAPRLQHGDRLPYDGAHYTVIGRPRGDHDHPVTGDDFGWILYTIGGGG